MEIIIDQNDGAFNGEVNPDEAKITENLDIILYTSDIFKCVGLGLLEKSKDKIKRGLTHLFYNPDPLKANEKVYTEEGLLIPKKEVVETVEKNLSQLLKNFKNPRAIIVCNCFDKTKSGEYVNPLANYVYDYLENNGADFIYPINLKNRFLSGNYNSVSSALMEWNEENSRTHYKSFALLEDKIRILHFAEPRNDVSGRKLKHGKALNPEDYERKLKLNW